MFRAQSLEPDVAAYQQFFNGLAQARTLEAAVQQCIGFIETRVGPRTCQIVWSNQAQVRVLGAPATARPIMPDAATRAWLEEGELVTITEEDQTATCFVPLRARGMLLGWLFVERVRMTAETTALLAALAAQAGPVFALLEAAGRYEERVAQLQTLTEIGRLLSGVLDLDTLLDAIYTATRRVLDASNFYIALYDPNTDMLELVYVVRDGERVAARQRWRPDEGLAGVVIAQRAPLYTDDYCTECARHRITPKRLADLPLGYAWIGVPLFAHDRFIGMLNVSSQRVGYTYTAEQVDLLATIGAQAAVAIENARLYQRSAKQARQLATLNEIGRSITSSLDPERVPSLIMSQVCELLNVDEGSLLLVEEETGDLVFAYTNGRVGSTLLGQRLPHGVGLAGYVVESGESVIVHDVQHDSRFYANTDQATGYTTRTLLAVPLRGVGGVQGVIEVLNRRDGERFTDDDRRLLEAVADQAVIALENAKRFAQIDQALARRAQELAQTNAMLQHNLQSLTALNAFGIAITSALRSPHEIFSMTARGVVEMTSALGASILLPDGDTWQPAVSVGLPVPVTRLVPVARQILHADRPTVLQSDALEAQALLAVPLRATQRTLGVLCVCYEDALPAASDQETVVLFATQAAAAVESIELFMAVRHGRDQMASILASTREGIALIEPGARVALANTALYRLCGVGAEAVEGRSVSQFLAAWEQTSTYAREEWEALRDGLHAVTRGAERFAAGELNGVDAPGRSLEWAALTAHGSGDSRGGALLVLRDITEAKEAERLRQDLTHMIIHDLRSPLSSIMASIDLLAKGVSGEVNPMQRNVLGIAAASAQQMLEMVNTLLDISRLESGRMPLDASSWEVGALVMYAANQLDTLARERNILIQSDIPAGLPPVHVDEQLIVRVIQNLLGNALKFSGRGSTVLIRAQAAKSGSFVQIAVRDCGIGIAPKDQEKIFTKFGQVGEKRGGTGLGLTFCKLAIEAHGGRIWVESVPNQGSAFFFTLPIAGP